MLVDMHPDVAFLSDKWNRVHHHVDYRPFRINQLIKKDGLIVSKGVNEYGMKLVNL
jgi:hypothetical protein